MRGECVTRLHWPLRTTGAVSYRTGGSGLGLEAGYRRLDGGNYPPREAAFGGEGDAAGGFSHSGPRGDSSRPGGGRRAGGCRARRRRRRHVARLGRGRDAGRLRRGRRGLGPRRRRRDLRRRGRRRTLRRRRPRYAARRRGGRFCRGQGRRAGQRVVRPRRRYGQRGSHRPRHPQLRDPLRRLNRRAAPKRRAVSLQNVTARYVGPRRSILRGRRARGGVACSST